MRDFPEFMADRKSSKGCARGRERTRLLPPLAALVAVLAFGACQTGGFQPIEIDLSKKTPTPEPSAPTPTRVPSSPIAARPSPTSTPAPRPESVSVPPVTPASPESPSVSGASGATPESVVDGQTTAFNRHDLETMLSFYAIDAVLYDYPDQVRHSGIEELRGSYAKAFADSPSLQLTVLHRLVQGTYVLDQATISGLPDGRSISIVAIYEVRDGKIRRVWFLR